MLVSTIFRLTSSCFFSFSFFFLKADYYVCLLVKRKKDGTVIGKTNSAHRTLDIAMYLDCSGERLVIKIIAEQNTAC